MGFWTKIWLQFLDLNTNFRQ